MLDRLYPYLIPMYNVWIQETTQGGIKPVVSFVVIAGSLDHERNARTRRNSKRYNRLVLRQRGKNNWPLVKSQLQLLHF